MHWTCNMKSNYAFSDFSISKLQDQLCRCQKIQGLNMRIFQSTSRFFFLSFLSSWRTWVDFLQKYYQGINLANFETIGAILALSLNFITRINLVNLSNFKDSFGLCKLNFDFLHSFHSRARFCRFSLIFVHFVKYPYMHIYNHKNTHSLAFWVSFWII